MKKITALLTALIMLCALSLSAFAEYVSVFDDTAETSEQDAAFEALEEEAAVKLINMSYIVQRNLIYDAEPFAAAHGFEPLKPSFWDNYTQAEMLDFFAEYYERLLKIDRSALTDRNKFDYDFMKNFLECQALLRDVDELITTDLGQESGISGCLRIPFVGLKDSAQDIVDILDAMETFGEYAAERCARELARLEKGMAPTPLALAHEYAACTELIETNCESITALLEEVFEEAGIPEDDRAPYRERMSGIITDVIIPAVNEILETVGTIAASGVEPKGYACYETGDKYFEYLLRSRVGINKDPEEMFAGAQEYLTEARAALDALLSDPENAALLAEPAAEELAGMTPQEIADYITEAMADSFEPPVITDYTVAPTPAELKDLKGRMMMQNTGSDPRDMSYILMVGEPDPDELPQHLVNVAHEGIPGHIYNYSNLMKNGSLFQLCAKMCYNTDLGFTEGWATYVEDRALSFSGVNDVQRQAQTINTIGGQCSGAAMSLYVNGLGKSFDEYYEMSGYADMPGMTEEIAKAYYYLLIEDPWDFIAYYEGWREMQKVREKAETELGDYFDEKDFHHFLMDIGCANFDVLEDMEEVWIEKTLAAHAETPEVPDKPDKPDEPETPTANPSTGIDFSVAVFGAVLSAAIIVTALKKEHRS